MADYITLLGAEQVDRASHTMSSAASEMQRAASSIEDTLSRHRMFLDDWLMRFEQALSAHPGPATEKE